MSELAHLRGPITSPLMIGLPFQPRNDVREIVFVRHAESQANVDGVWNGRTDGPLSPNGEKTLNSLGDRLSKWRFDTVVSSPLERALRTARSFADDIKVDDEFIEIDLGRFEGRKFEDIQSNDANKLETAIRDRSVPMGQTGESLDQAARRSLAAVDGLAASLGEGQRAAVVTHGGFMQAVLHRHLAGHQRRAHAFTANTAITRVLWQFGTPRLASFNDVSHLAPRSALVDAQVEAGARVLALIRHGRTQANVESRWQGHGDWELDDHGLRQARALGDWYGRHPRVYASPLKRAASTADHVASNGVRLVDGLKELGMGRWEGLTTSDIAERWPGELEIIFRDGVDLRRGVTGESWGELTARFVNAIESFEMSDGEPTVVVAHGGAIRAYISSLTKTHDTHAESLFTPANTSVSHVALTERGPEIIDYSVAPHLEALQ